MIDLKLSLTIDEGDTDFDTAIEQIKKLGGIYDVKVESCHECNVDSDLFWEEE